METLKFKVGVVQLNIRTNYVEDNIARTEGLVREAARVGCRLVVVPEAFSTGLNLPQAKKLAQPVPGPLTRWLGALAASESVYLAAGLLEVEEERVYSTAVLFDERGRLLQTYRRVFIYQLESYFLSPGTSCRVLETPLGRLGLLLGYDLQFPELPRVLFSQRVELILCPSLLLKPFAASIRQMALARAAENCCYFLFASAAGENTLAGLTYMGESLMLQSPMGIRPYSNEFKKQQPVLAEAGQGDLLLCAEVDLYHLRRLQQINPLYNDFIKNPFYQNELKPIYIGERPCHAS